MGRWHRLSAMCALGARTARDSRRVFESIMPVLHASTNCGIGLGFNRMKGEVVFLYAFDVANEIITSRVQEILSAKPFPFEIRMDRTLPKDMPLYKPLAIEPPPLAASLHGAPVQPVDPHLRRGRGDGDDAGGVRGRRARRADAVSQSATGERADAGCRGAGFLRESLRRLEGFAGGPHGISTAAGSLHGVLPHRSGRREGRKRVAGRTAARRWPGCSPRRRRRS